MPTGLFSTDGVIGNREDLTNVLTNISPTETPFLSSIGRTRASGVFHEWQTDTLAAAAANAAAEGASAAPASGGTTTRIGNRCQIFTKELEVSNTQMSVSVAGRASEWEYQMKKRMKELARDIEFQLVNSSAQAAGDTTADTARQLEGWGMAAITNATAGFLSSNVESVLTTASDTGTRKNLTETVFNNALQTCWNSGGNPDAIHVNGYNKRVISSFSANATRTASVDFGNTSLQAAVDVYQSDFGIVKILLNRYVAATNVGIIETQYWNVAELRPLEFSRLAKTGDRELGQFVTELTLQAMAPTSSGKIIGVASAEGATT
jgi:hypothetical protein